MRKIVALLFLLLLLPLFGSGAAFAQPTCVASNPGSIACQSQAVNPQLTDILAATQATGPLRTNQSVKLSLSQLLNLGGSTQYMSFGGGTLTGKLTTKASAIGVAGFNILPGVAPTSPVDGDVWTTTAGMFVQADGVTLGPLGAGGGANTGGQNSIGWYAASGNTLSALSTLANGVLIANGSGVPSFATTLPIGLTLTGAFIQPAVYPNAAALPVVTGTNQGRQAFVANCLNGTETGGSGTGCAYSVDNTGAWRPVTFIPTQQITVGGQALKLGQTSTDQGTGSKIATFTGTSTSGNCVSFAASGALQDAGAPCGGGSGGSGTVTAGTANQLTWYASSGTAVAGLASVNNAVLGTSGAGVPALSTTLPSALTIPSPTVSNPALTGAGTYVGLTGTGKLNVAASTTTQAGLTVLPGVAPTAPVNGDIWSTNAGFFMRYNGGTFSIGSGSGTITGITPAFPLTGGGTSGAVALNCPTCLTTSAGGVLSVSTPLVISGSALSVGAQTKPFVFNADQYTTIANASYTVFLAFPYATGSITSITDVTGGTSSPSFTAGVQINGVNVTTCNGLTVTTVKTTTVCGANTIVSGNTVTLEISGVNGAPSSTVIQINYTASAS